MDDKTATPGPFKLSLTPPSNISAKVIDFSATPISSYHSPTPHFAMIIDNFLSPEECADLISFATTSSPSGKWEPALINTAFKMQTLATEYRNSGRIMVDDYDVAGMLYERMLPFIPADIKMLEADGKWWGSIFGYSGKWRKGPCPRVWKMCRMNERLRFLRYEKGNYFHEHYDAQYSDPRTGQKSFLTFQLYLSDNKDVMGGATRFSSRLAHYDVEPKMGRVLIFQQSGMVHSGAEVDGGIKITVRSDIMYEKMED